MERRSLFFLRISLFGHYMFRPNLPSSNVQVFMVKDSAAHCNEVLFPPIVVASGYFGLCGLPNKTEHISPKLLF
jgi:hypothetical protein